MAINNPYAIRQEIQRFESVHPSIYAIYDLIELIPDLQVATQLREHIVQIEGRLCGSTSSFITQKEAENEYNNNKMWDDAHLFLKYRTSGVERKMKAKNLKNNEMMHLMQRGLHNAVEKTINVR